MICYCRGKIVETEQEGYLFCFIDIEHADRSSKFRPANGQKTVKVGLPTINLTFLQNDWPAWLEAKMEFDRIAYAT